MDTVADQNAAGGVWSGWGYYWSITSKIFHSDRPYKLVVGEDLDVYTNPTTADPQAKLDLKSLKWTCAPGKFCTIG